MNLDLVEEKKSVYPESGWHLCCQDNKTSNMFLRVKPGFDSRVRLLFSPYKLVKIFTNDRRCLNLNSEDIGRQLQQKYGDKLNDISERICSWCIDRTDDTLKILDLPMSVSRTIGNHESLAGKKIPGIEQGCDWRIITNGKTGMDVRYEAIYIEETPLTEAQKDMIKNSGIEQDLSKIFKPLNFEDAEKKILGLDG